MQVLPRERDPQRWAYKTVFWPEDDEAAIQVDDPLTNLLMELIHGDTAGAPDLPAIGQQPDRPHRVYLPFTTRLTGAQGR
jgi:hypothetical protein